MKTINKYSFIISILTLLVSSLTYAEGTPSLSPNSANITAVLVAPDILSGSYSNCPEDNRIYFNIANNATERIYFGFDWRGYSVGSPLRVTNMYYRIKNPAGTVVASGKWNETPGTAGSIDTYAQAIAGPNISGSTPGGYLPLNYDPVVNGEHWIEFYRSDDNGVTANAQRGVAPYFDLTVATVGGVRRNGRVHSDKWGFVAVDSNFGNFITANSEPNFYAYTNDQVVLFIDFRPGFQPIAYNLAVNSYGVTPTGPFNITRRSVNSTLSPSLPNGFKVFLNNPDSTVYPVAAIPAAPTFLTPAITGCGNAYQIRYNITSPGDVRLLLDLNGVSGYQPNTADRLIEVFNVGVGNNVINWNGLDGQGNLVPDGTSMSLTLYFLAGRFNLPIYDAELNKNGFNVQSIAPIAIPNSQMYWDDTQLTNVGSSCAMDGSTQENNLTGAGWDYSLNGATSPTRAWSGDGNSGNTVPAPANGANETDGITCNDFGNVRVLNTWGWGLTNQSTATTVFKGCSDLRVVKTVSNSAPTIGSNVTFTITATNLGVSNDTNVVLNDLLPAGYTLVSATPSTGSYSSATGVWTIGNFNNLANATLTIVATVNVSGSYTNTATITGTNFDPNLTNNTSSVTPVPVNSVINAVNDNGSSINGFVGGTSFTNILVNDTLNGVAVVPSQVNTTFVSSTNPGVTLSGTNVVVAPGTPAGNYVLIYQICEIVNPTNCDTAFVTVPVTAPAIDAVNDAGTPVNGYNGGTAFNNILFNDTLNGVAVVPSQVNTTFVSSTHPGITLSGTNVVVAPGTPAGNYTLTYQICQITNPTNCDTATVTVPVTAAAIEAKDDTGNPVNGFVGGTSFTNVLVNDTLNGVAIIPSQVTTTFVSSTNPGVTLSGTNVVVAAGTPAGNYTLTYQICEVLNPTNCDTAVVTVPVTAPAIDAVNDSGASINGLTGGTSFTNVLSNDTLNGSPVVPSQVTTTFVSSTHPGVTLSGTNVVVAAGTPAGNYTLTYQICQNLNPTNCDTAVVTVPVTAASIEAKDDTGTTVNGYVGGTSFTNVLVNDTLNGVAVLPSQVATSFVSSTHPGITLSGTNVVVAAGTPAGNYTLTYQICEILNPTNCDIAVVTVPVTAASIEAKDDTGNAVNGYVGGTSFTNVLVNDTLNGVAVVPSQVITTFVSSTNPGVTLSGTNVVVAAGTPAGNYTLTYQICEVLNPTNCDTAVVTVPVTAATIDAVNDTGASVNGFTGGTSFSNVLGNDTLNGVAVVPSQVTTTFVSSTNPGVTLSGTNVVVAPGTPVGNYTLTYQICEILNPSNCDTAVVTVPVNAASIDAVNDAGSSINGYVGGTSFTNILVNDTLNGNPVIASQVTTSFISSTHPGVTLSGTNVVVAAGTPAGNYTLTYQICENLNPSNCDTATVTVPVTAPVIDAVNDAGNPVNGFTGGTSFTNVLINDTLNGAPVVPSQVTTTFVSSTNPGVTLSGTNVVVAAGTPAGNYTLTYQICQNLNPTNCDTAVVTVTVSAPVIDAVNDAGTPINSYVGGTALTNVLANDTLNGAPVVPSQVTTTFVSSTNPGVTLSGTNVVVAAGTPAGNYTLTYQICQVTNPTNCDTAIVTVPVTAPAIVANNDNGSTINGYVGGTSFTNVLVNDTLNGAPVIASQVTTTFISSTNPGVTLSGTNVVVAAGTPAGNYTLTYQICEIVNPTNCDTAIVTVPVTAAAIDAVNDNGSPINGYTGGTALTNVLSNDTLNGVAVIPSQVNTTFVSSTNPGITLSGTNVVVAPGTPAGNYTLIYQICEILNPTNCDTATVTVPVNAATIVANDDTGSTINGYTGGTSFTNVLVNDTLNGAPVVASQVNTTFVSSTNPGVTLSGTNVVVAAGTPAGNYTLVYQICEILNPTNCDTAVVTVPVTAATIDAVNDAGTPVNGYVGGTALTNVLANDTLNGVAVIPSQVTTTFVSSTNPGITLSGTNVVVAPGTPAGNYTLTYQICEVLNPSNCDTATVTVPVTAAPIVANDDAGAPTNGYTGGTAFTNVLVNDTLNGVAVVPSQVTTTFVSSTNPGIILSGTNVVVAPGTPAGNYTLTYQICEVLNPTNCDTAVVTVPVNAAPIVANDDTGASVNGFTGGSSFTNVLGNDTLNGVAVLPSQVTTTFVSSTNPGVTLSGTNVVVAPGTPVGNYTLTYQICEILNPTNCDTAIVTVPVNAASIDAVNDFGTPVNGYVGGTSFTNILGNDTLNGSPVDPSQITTTFVSSTNPGVTLSGTNVVVAAGTPSGNYTLTYQICEILNPTNCDTATVTVPVTAATIVANDDAGSSINGLVGGTSFTNILANDTLNGNPVIPSQVTTTFVSSTNSGVTLSGTNVVVAPGTPAGNYILTYQICEVLNPANCDTAIVTVPVTAAAIDAVNDTIASTNGTNGNPNAGNVLTSNGNGPDTLNGVPVTISQVTISVVTPATPVTTGAPVPTVDPVTGQISIPANTPAGNYTITYQICEILNPTNCDTAVVTIPVSAATIVANDDTMPSTIGMVGNANLGNVLPNNGNGPDTLNGTPLANLALVTMTVTTPATPINGGLVPTLNTTTGVVSVPVGTPAGTYTITYQICQNLNPTNCDTAVVTIPVTAAAIDAVNDTIASTNGTNGNPNAGNVLTSNGNGPDTLNGVPVTISQVIISVVTPATPVTSGAPVPTVDPVTGQISIPANTPAGNYTITYQICEILNPTNCDTAVVTIPVSAATIVANDDTMPSTIGMVGNANLGNVLPNNGNGPDTLNGTPLANLALVTMTVTTPATPINGGLVPTLNTTTGVVSVPVGTPAGTYTITYQICQNLNPTNCDTAVVTIPVTAAVIDAVNDTIASTNGTNGNPNAGNVLTSNGNGPDTLNGVPVTISQVIISVVTPATPITTGAPVPAVDPVTGQISIPANTPAGNYTITYQICEILNPTNCDTAVVTIPVSAATIVANDDTMPSTIGMVGNANLGNVLPNNGNGPDTLNGTPLANLALVTMTVTTPATPINGGLVPTLNTTTGVVSVPVGTPAGTYTITYQICQNLNPTNCDTAIVTIPVSAATIIANDDAGSQINSQTGGTAFTNVLVNDTLNGVAVVPSQVITTFVSSTNSGITLSGTDVVVAVGTPAGNYTLTYQICEVLNPTNCDTAIVTVPVYTPSIQLLKNGTYSDSSLPSGANVGDTIIYNFTVINTGSAPLTNVTVTDPLVTVVGGPIPTLAIGASDSTTFTATYTITQADIDAGQVNNLALVTGTPPSGPSVTDNSSDPTPCDTCTPVTNCPDCTLTPLPTQPGIELLKDGTYADSSLPTGVSVGDTITYAFTVSNIGNVTLTNVTVTDPNVTVLGGPIPTLVVGQVDTTTFTAVYTITQADIDAGQVDNLATATGTPPSGPPVTDTSSDPTPCQGCTPLDPSCTTCTITDLPQAPSIDVTKDGTYVDTNADGIVNVGDTVTYAFVVTNTGNVTLTNITITDNNAVVTGGPLASLAPGASDNLTFTAVHVITQADVDAGQVDNLATVTGEDPNGDPVTDTSTDPTPCCTPLDPSCTTCTITDLPQAPSIDVTKDGTYVDTNADGIVNVGDTVTYAFVVTNTGNVTLTNITITDNNAVVTGGPLASLAPGASDNSTFTAVHVITQADVDAGQVDNLATVTGEDPYGDPVTDTSTDPTPCCTPLDPSCTTCTITDLPQAPSIDVTKDGTYVDTNADGIVNVGDTVTYAFVVTNTGNVTLTNITITDNNAVVTGGPLASLAPGASDNSTFTAVHVITQADVDAGQVDNLATVTGEDPYGDPVTDTSTDPTPCCTPLDPSCTTCTITDLPQAPSIDVTKDGTYVDTNADGIVNVGDTVTYAFVVTNTGNVTLTNITITDNNAVVTGGPLASLAPGASDNLTFTAVHVITQADVDAGQVDNLATVTGEDPNGDPVTDTSTDPTPCCTPLDPSCTTCTITDLPQAPSIDVTKDGTYVDTNADGIVNVGDTVTYAFVVTNTGNVTLTNITITDNNAVVTGGPLASLAPGASDNLTFTAVHVITQADVDAGQVDNLATVTGEDPNGDPVTDTSTDPTPCCTPLDPSCTTCTITDLPQAPSIDVTKDGTYVDTNADGIVNVGDTVTYAFVVTNTGNVTLTNITITDNNAVVTGGPLASLAPGASDNLTFTAVHVITQADVDAGQVDNLATVTGEDPNGDPVTDTSTDPTPCCTPLDPSCTTCTITDLPQAPSIDVTKDGTYVDTNADGIVNVGDTVTYAFVVTNTGNVTLTNITITDNNAVVTGGPLASLAPGASDNLTFTAVHVITQADVDAGQVDNLATVTGEDPNGDPVTDTSTDPTPCCTPLDPSCTTCTITDLPQAPSIDVTKDGTYVDTNADGIVNVGDTVTYAFVVTNTGNVTLTNITITDNNAVVTGGPLASLAPGASDNLTFTAVHVITQADVDAGQVDNLATVTGEDPNGDPVTDTSTDPTPCCTPLDPSCTTCTITDLPQAPSIDVTKDGTYVDTNADGIVNVGDTVTYAFVVTNTGNVTLTNITITDNNAVVTGGPLASLAPGASDNLTFTAVHVITQADVDAGQVDNLATVTGEDPNGDPVTDTSTDPTPCCTPLDPSCTTCTITDLPQAPSIDVTKDGTYVDTNADGIVNVGDTVTYAFVVTNTGNVTLTNITITDNNAVVTGGPLASLAPGASDNLTFTAVHVITQADVDAGQVDNLATVTGEDPNGDPVTDTSTDPTPCCTPLDPSCTTCTITDLPQAPSIDVTKDGTYVDTNADGITNIGDTITYVFVVTNTGNVTLTNITITDNNAVVTGGPLASLAPGASDNSTFTAVHVITQADIDAGNVYNLATACGTQPNNSTVCDDSTDPTPCASCPSDPNCPTCTITPLINAVDDTFNSISCDVNTLVGNVLTNDTVGNIPVNTVSPLTDVNFTLLSGTYPNISIDANGNINVLSGITVGQYLFTYSICSASTPNMCDQATVTVNIIDDVDPFWTSTLPGDETVSCDNVPQAPTLTAQDICSVATVDYSQTIQNGNCQGNYVIIRTWTATDASGNSIVHTQTITVQDLTNPTFVEALPADVTVECSAVPQPEVLTATDNCGTATVVYNQVITQGSCEGNYTIVRTWTATDLCNNQTVHTQTITVQDTTDPTFDQTLPADLTIECSAVPTAPTLTATDNCGLANVNFFESTAAGTCAGAYTITRTWIAIDPCGNTNIHTQTITVQDTTAPTFVETLPANVTVECSAVPEPEVLTAIDNCGTATVAFVESTTPGSCSGSYTITRTWTATDLCNNQTVHTQTITVQDTTDPAFIGDLPADVTVECSLVPAPATLTATDNCGTATVTFNQTNTPGNCAGAYTITRTWTATDSCGNDTVYTQLITVQDTTDPTFVEGLPQDATVECSAVPAPVTLTAIDNCGTASVVFNQTNTPGNCAGNYTITRTWTATDLCGNQLVHTQTITVQDTTDPTFVEGLPSDITVECSAVPAPVTLTAVDNCGTAAVTYTESTTPGNCAGNYVITRTWTATDLCNNQLFHTQTITVQDTTAPTFVETLPDANITVECSTVPAAVTLTATDNCGTATVAFTETTTPGSCAGAYIITRTWTATDLCNNPTTFVQTVTVQDTTQPTFVEALPANATVECSAVPAAATLTAIDNCGTATVAFTETTAAGTCAGNYTITRTWTATDLCNNQFTHTQIITVQDTTDPTLVGTLVPVIEATCSAIPDAPVLTFTDNCSSTSEITVVSTSETSEVTEDGTYTIVRTWTVTDACGNDAVFTQTVNVTIPNYQLDESIETVCNIDIDLTIDLASVLQILLPGTPTDGTWVDTDNTGALDGAIFTPYHIEDGSYVFTYLITSEDCPRSIRITVPVNGDVCTVENCVTITVHNAMTPNNDALNEIFFIENINITECYPENTVEIYNRWGVKVYDAENYDNTTRVFTGVSEGRTTVKQSAELPTGTYFYILKYKTLEGNYVTKNGYLYLSR